jgi:hypothetical protein
MNSVNDTPKGWVAPFGHLGINACSRLPQDFRSVPRPSSPPGAKASTRCPSHTQNQEQSPLSVIRREINDRSKASHRTHPTVVSRRSGAVVSRQSPAVRKRHETTTTTTPKQHRRMDQLHTHFRIFGQWPVVGRQTSEQRDTSPSDGLRPPSCPDRPKTQQNLIHNHQRTQRPTRDQSSDDSRQNTTITKPLTNQTLTNPNPLTTDDWRPSLETDGFEPTTPCLQSRCSPS